MASSSQGEERAPGLAVDGLESTLWHSQPADGEWIRADLGAERLIDGLQLHWKFGYPKDFEIAVASTADGPWRNISAQRGYDGVVAIELAEDVRARFVRIRGLERGTDNMGFALSRLIVYGE